MGRIISPVTITNAADPSKSIHCDALVDTGAAHMVLPTAWKDRLGDLELLETVQVETATQETVPGELRGPVRIQLEGFRATFSVALFIEMHPAAHGYEPLIGYIVLEQAQIAVDMVGHRLIQAGKVDLK